MFMLSINRNDVSKLLIYLMHMLQVYFIVPLKLLGSFVQHPRAESK
jgi:hypothetical protein